MNERENFLRTLEFRNPQWIRFSIHLGWPVWHRYRGDLEELVLRYPKIFRHKKGSVDFDGDPGPGYRQGEYFRDTWGCVRYSAHHGMSGLVVESPLADWKALDTFQPPDLNETNRWRGFRDWDRIATDVEDEKGRGLLTQGHGEDLFDRLFKLRGFENLMMDVATDDPHLPQLISLLTDYEMRLVQQWISLGVDIIGFHTDIGMKDRLMISPDKFRKYIKPMFKQIFSHCRDAGVHVGLSSDGRLLEIVDDLIECRISMHDPQIRANTLAGIEESYKGKLCTNLDLDRQMFAVCRPDDIEQQVKAAVEQLSLPEGGLMMFAYMDDANTPMENIEAMCEAGYQYCLADKPG